MAIKIVTDEKMEIDVNGKIYGVTVPSLKKFSDLDKKVKSLNSDDIADFYCDYFNDLGLPKEVSSNFSLKNWTMLIEGITGIKKA